MAKKKSGAKKPRGAGKKEKPVPIIEQGEPELPPAPEEVLLPTTSEAPRVTIDDTGIATPGEVYVPDVVLETAPPEVLEKIYDDWANQHGDWNALPEIQRKRLLDKLGMTIAEEPTPMPEWPPIEAGKAKLIADKAAEKKKKEDAEKRAQKKAGKEAKKKKDKKDDDDDDDKGDDDTSYSSPGDSKPPIAPPSVQLSAPPTIPTSIIPEKGAQTFYSAMPDFPEPGTSVFFSSVDEVAPPRAQEIVERLKDVKLSLDTDEVSAFSAVHEKQREATIKVSDPKDYKWTPFRGGERFLKKGDILRCKVSNKDNPRHGEWVYSICTGGGFGCNPKGMGSAIFVQHVDFDFAKVMSKRDIQDAESEERWERNWPGFSYIAVDDLKFSALTYDDYREALAGEGWAQGDYKGMLAKADTPMEQNLLRHIIKEEDEHQDELLTVMDDLNIGPDNDTESYSSDEDGQWWTRGQGKVVITCPNCGATAVTRANWRTFTCFECSHIIEHGKEAYSAAVHEKQRLATISVPKPGYAYTAVDIDDKYTIGRADYKEPGYVPSPWFGIFDTYDEAKEKADKLNEELGLTRTEAFKIIASSMGASRRQKYSSNVVYPESLYSATAVPARRATRRSGDVIDCKGEPYDIVDTRRDGYGDIYTVERGASHYEVRHNTRALPGSAKGHWSRFKYSCQCRGWQFYRRCKHTAGLAGLLEDRQYFAAERQDMACTAAAAIGGILAAGLLVYNYMFNKPSVPEGGIRPGV